MNLRRTAWSRAPGALLLTLASALWASPALALTAAEVFARISPSVWHVRTYDRDGLRLATGSAVVVDQRTVVTNCHVLFRASRIVISQGKTVHPARLTLWDTARDLCELRVQSLEAPAVTLADMRKLAVGQPVYAIGSPFGLELSLSAGLVSSLRKDSDDQLRQVQTTAPISSGSSGGGLFDEQGQLIGITTSFVKDSAAQNLNFAIPASYWIDLPARHAAALKAVQSGQEDALAKALEAPEPTIAFKPVVTTAANTARSAWRLSDPLPFVNRESQTRIRSAFLAAPLPRALAIADNGATGLANGFAPAAPGSSGDPQERALALCEQAAGKPCVIYAIDDEVLYQAPPKFPAP